MDAAARRTNVPNRIEEYQILAEIGRGAMGSIFLARDALLGRDVALKLVPPEELSTEAKTLFFHEARALARVSHTNVVGIHRVGEIDGLTYLVTELVKGGSLADLPKPIPWKRALVLGIGMARGLSAAHRKKVLHRDIKPANVMLGEEGDVKLVDFGLAKLIEQSESGLLPAPGHAGTPAPWAHVSRSGEIAGTPLYMAPEVLYGKPASVQSDVYGVGAVLYELVTAVAPRDTLPEDAPLPSWISDDPAPMGSRAALPVDSRFTRIVMRCLAASPVDRFPNAEALAEALEALQNDDEAGEMPTGNPYRGLEPFELEHRGAFFGRDAEIRAAIHRMREASLLVVAGDSGVGKSSLCKAGVLPRLSREALERERALRIVGLVPGQTPLRALSSALAPLLSGGAFDIPTLIDADEAALYRELTRGLGPAEDLLLFVDQLEEICTLSDPQAAERFGEAMLRACAGPRVRVLATLRGDFITQVAALSSLGPALGKNLFLLRPMTDEGIRAAIVKPALRKGVAFESEELVDELVRASTEMPGGLPLLEFALAEIWEARDEARGAVTRQVLREIGSVSGALARHADAVLDALGPEERVAARRVLLSLTHTKRTRARRTSAELGVDEPATRAAVDALVRGRLIVARSMGNEGVYEVAHEALLREWQTLRGWIEETRERGQFIQEIEEAAELWDRRGRREEETWAGDALAQAVTRVEKWEIELGPVPRAFFSAGVARKERGQRRRRLILGSSAGALLLIASVSTVAAVAFAEKERQAIAQQAQIRLASGDMGQFELVLAPFDWDAAKQRSSPARVPEALDWRIFSVSPENPRDPGKAYGSDDMRRSNRRREENALREMVEARSGPAFIEVLGRGEGCESSFVRIQRLPGYTDRISGAPQEIRISVPTCQATREDTVEIPAGPFYKSDRPPDDSADWSHEIVDELAFRMDRTEVTQSAFAMYGAMEGLTGDGAARTAYLDPNRPGGERLPIVGVNVFTAAGYCRFMGKTLPSLNQWLKAMRGGFEVVDRSSPEATRKTPWLKSTSKYPANVDADDAFSDLAPVGSFAEDRSPYGILDMAGNVSEWTREPVPWEAMRGLQFVLGASWDTPTEHAQWRNMRPDRYLDFTIGIRCVKGR